MSNPNTAASQDWRMVLLSGAKVTWMVFGAQSSVAAVVVVEAMPLHIRAPDAFRASICEICEL